MEFTNSIIYSTHPIDLYKYINTALKGLGAWLSWEPEVLFKNLNINKPNSNSVNKVLAVQSTAANTELPCKNHLAFESVGNCFCNEHFIAGTSQPIGIEECMYTVNQIKLIAKEVHKVNEDLVTFYGEIPGYVASVAKLHSHRVLPIPLNFGQDILDYLYPNYGVNLTEEKHIAEVIDKADLSELADLDRTDNKFIHWLVGCYRYDPTMGI